MENLKDIIASGDPKAIASFMIENDLILDDGKIIAKNDQAKISLKAKIAFWNARQQTRKILLNSLA